jgi:hypothetical protein
MSVMRELDSIDKLVKLGRGAVEICLTENGNVGIFWTGRDGCQITGDSVENCLMGRYFRNEIEAIDE